MSIFLCNPLLLKSIAELCLKGIPSTNPIFLHYKKCLIFAVMDAKNITQFAIMQTHIAACKASGITVEAYCRNHQLKPSVYYYWRKKLQPEEPGKFISITPLLSTAPVRITFTNGKRISFETMPPVDYVKQLMA